MLVVVIIVALAIGMPLYNVWSKGLEGKANLQKAEHERKILIEQAKAEKESAGYRAEAIQIVGQAAKDFPEYRTQEFIGAFGEAVQNDSINKIIFIPTEAGIPLVTDPLRYK